MFDYISDCIEWTLDFMDDMMDFCVERPLIPIIIIGMIVFIVGTCSFSPSTKPKITDHSSHYSQKTDKYYTDPFNTEYQEEIKEESKDDNSITVEIEVSTEKEVEKNEPFTYHIISIMDGKKDIDLHCEKYHYEGDDIIIEKIFKKNCCGENIERVVTKKDFVRKIEDKTAKSKKRASRNDCFIGILMDYQNEKIF